MAQWHYLRVGSAFYSACAAQKAKEMARNASHHGLHAL
jgi:hypothetical protein